MDCNYRELRRAFNEGRVAEFLQIPGYEQGEIVSDEEQIQDSPGALNPPESKQGQNEFQETARVSTPQADSTQLNYENVGRSIESVPISSIRQVRQIKDYSVRTKALRPILTRTPQGFFCLDGWHYIEEAASRGLDSIECEIDTIANHSETELMMRKAAIRTETRGGDYICPELVRNTRDIYNHLKATNLDLRDFSHGGNRRGEGFVDSPEEDIRHLIATRLGLSRSTINDHLNYANCLSDEIIEYLIQNKANKKFFDNSRKEKSKLLRSLESQRLSGEEKTRRISDFMRDLYEGTGGEGRLRASGQPHTPVSNGPVEQQANNSHLTDPEGTAPGAANDGDEGQGDESEELNELSDDEPSQDQDEEPDIEDCSIDSAVDISELKEEAAEIAVNLNLAIRDACNIDELESCIAQGIADFEEVRRRLHSLQGEIC